MSNAIRIIVFLVILLMFVPVIVLALVRTNTVAPPANAPRGVHRAYAQIQQEAWLVCEVTGTEYGEHEAYIVPKPGLTDDGETVLSVSNKAQTIIEAMIEEEAPMTVEEARRRWEASENTD